MSYGHQGYRGERWPLRLARLEEAAVDHHHLHGWVGDPHALQLHPAPAVHQPLTGVIGVAGRPRAVWGVDAGATLDRVNDPGAGLVDPREAHVLEAAAVVIRVAAREADRAARPHPLRRRDIAPTHPRGGCPRGWASAALVGSSIAFPNAPSSCSSCVQGGLLMGANRPTNAGQSAAKNGSQPAQKQPIFRQSG
jgi:hypothetical protein